MSKVLIIRSVSLQQLDLIIGKIIDKFPKSEFQLLTPPHNREHCQKYKDIRQIIDYPEKTSYSCFTVPEAIKKEQYDAVVIPVSNLKGSGFLNVLLMGLRVKTRNIYICNLATEIKKVSKLRILLKAKLGLLSIPFSAILTAVTVVPVSLILLIRLKKKR